MTDQEIRELREEVDQVALPLSFFLYVWLLVEGPKWGSTVNYRIYP